MIAALPALFLDKAVIWYGFLLATVQVVSSLWTLHTAFPLHHQLPVGFSGGSRTAWWGNGLHENNLEKRKKTKQKVFLNRANFIISFPTDSCIGANNWGRKCQGSCKWQNWNWLKTSVSNHTLTVKGLTLHKSQLIAYFPWYFSLLTENSIPLPFP